MYGIADDAEHPPRLVVARRELVGPVGNARPSGCVEELLRRDIQRVAVDMRAAADACAAEDEHIVQVLQPLNPVQLRGGEPQIVLQIPVGLRDVFVPPAPAGLHDADPVALLRGAQRGDAAAEPGADDHYVVVEARHGIFSVLLPSADTDTLDTLMAFSQFHDQRKTQDRGLRN